MPKLAFSQSFPSLLCASALSCVAEQSHLDVNVEREIRNPTEAVVASNAPDTGASPSGMDGSADTADAGLVAVEPSSFSLGQTQFIEDMQRGCARFMQQLEAGASVSEAVSRLLELDEQYLLDEWDPDDMLPSIVNACTGEGPPLDQLRRNALYDMAKHWDFEEEERDVCIDDLLPFPDAPAEFAQALGYPETDLDAVMARLSVSFSDLRVAAMHEVSSYGDTLDEYRTETMEEFLWDLYIGVPAYSDNPLYHLDGASAVEVDWSYWRIEIWQPYDHSAPERGEFIQEVRVGLRDLDAPNVLVVGGPGSPTQTNLDEWLRTNTIEVSPRFSRQGGPLARSWPADASLWRFQTAEQAALDLHRVLEVLKPVLRGPWISEGEFRGAGLALVHRRLFPEDVLGTIAFNATLGTAPPSGGLSLIENSERPELAEWVAESQAELLTNLPSMRRASDSEVCLRDMDLELLSQAAAYFEWAAWTKPLNHCVDYVPASPGSAAEVFAWSLRRLRLDGAVQPQVHHWELSEWGHLETLRSKHEAAHAEARMRLGLSETTDAPTPWMTEPDYDPSTLQATATWLGTEGHDVVLVYQEGDPMAAWPVGVPPAVDTLTITLPGNQPCWDDAPDRPDADTRRALRNLLESWVGSNVVYPERFDGR